MKRVRISPKFQIVIPRVIRESLGLRSGTNVHIIQYDDRIELIPEKKMKSMRGFLKGIDTTIEREGDRV